MCPYGSVLFSFIQLIGGNSLSWEKDTIRENNQSISEKVNVLGENCESGINEKTHTVKTCLHIKIKINRR